MSEGKAATLDHVLPSGDRNGLRREDETMDDSAELPSAGGVRLPSVLGVAAIGIATAAILVMHFLNAGIVEDDWWVGSVAVFVGLCGSGLVLIGRVPSNRIGWMMLVGGVAQGVMALAGEWAVLAGATYQWLPGEAWAAWLDSWPWMISMATFPMVLAVFPDGQHRSRGWKIYYWVLVAATFAGCVSSALLPGVMDDRIPGTKNPMGVDSPLVRVGGVVPALVLVVAIAIAVGSVLGRTARATGVLRQQLKWVAFAGAILATQMLLELSRIPVLSGVLPWTGAIAPVVFLASIAAAVLRYRLWDIDIVIRYSVIYGALTCVLAGLYLGVVFLSAEVGNRDVQLQSSIVAALLVAFAYAPLRDRLQRFIRHRIYGDRTDPVAAIAKLGNRLGDSATSDTVLDEVVESIAASLRLRAIAIVVPQRGVVAAVGTPGPGAQSTPLVFRSMTVGELLVSPGGGSRLGRQGGAVLDSLAPLVAAVVYAVEVGNDLQRSRRALVTAREEERRRIRRDLHDGLGPSLAAISMKLEGASRLLASDPQEASAILERLDSDIRTVIADVRVLVHDLAPPALAEMGLLTAVAAQTTAFTGLNGGRYLQVDLVAPESLDPMPAAVEVAAYRIICEALNNVLRHSGAGRCVVSVLQISGAELRVSVDDDGRGSVTRTSRGLGVHSMSERAEELGGAFDVLRSPLGGTRVVASLPVKASRCDEAGEDLVSDTEPDRPLTVRHARGVSR